MAADHLDSNTLATNPLGDINDVFTWMTTDAKLVNLAMTISPLDPGTRHFSDAVQYVFHVWSRGTDAAHAVAKPGMGTETRVICTFTSDTAIQCWVVQGTTVKDYVTGDPSATAGITSADGKVRVFAGRRSDPFFFNLGGFLAATQAVHDNLGNVGALDAAGCPTNLPATGALSAQTLRTVLASPPQATIGPCAAGAVDCFANANVMAIVMQVDKTLLNDGTNTQIAVYASTHAKP